MRQTLFDPCVDVPMYSVLKICAVGYKIEHETEKRIYRSKSSPLMKMELGSVYLGTELVESPCVRRSIT